MKLTILIMLVGLILIWVLLFFAILRLNHVVHLKTRQLKEKMQEQDLVQRKPQKEE